MGDGQTGRCRVRGARNGELQALAYGCVSSLHLDPVEKKPLYHFHPGRQILSVGGWGCNLGCEFCQNWQISQRGEKGQASRRLESIVQIAAAEPGNIGIAYTYNEPVVGVEFVMDCARAARGSGLRNVLVTNGFIQAKPAADLLQWVDALNVDVKSMDEEFYRRHCKGSLAPVLSFCRQAVEAGCHVEITHLTIPGMNDSMENMERLASWISESLGVGTPLHLSAYFPSYRFAIAETEPEILFGLREAARHHLSHVYVGNLHGRHEGGDTHCSHCGSVLIRRAGYHVAVCGICEGKCASCGILAGVIGSI
jgi:pyruvate formate lyase activating enzyme